MFVYWREAMLNNSHQDKKICNMYCNYVMKPFFPNLSMRCDKDFRNPISGYQKDDNSVKAKILNDDVTKALERPETTQNLSRLLLVQVEL